MINRILTLLIFFFLGFVVFEGVMYFGVTQQKNKQAAVFPQPTAIPEAKMVNAVKRAVDRSFLESLANSSKSGSMAVKTIVESKFTIKSLSKDINAGSIHLALAFDYIDTEGKDIFFGFSDNLYKKTKVFIKENGINRATTIDSLAVGDTIDMIQTFDSSLPQTDPNQIISCELYKVAQSYNEKK